MILKLFNCNVKKVSFENCGELCFVNGIKKKKGGLKLFSELSFIPATFLIVTFRYLNYTVKFLRTKNSSLFIFV